MGKCCIGTMAKFGFYENLKNKPHRYPTNGAISITEATQQLTIHQYLVTSLLFILTTNECIEDDTLVLLG